MEISNAILAVIKKLNVRYDRVYREKRKGEQFIDGKSFKLYCTAYDADKLEQELRDAALPVSVKSHKPSKFSRRSLVITYCEQY